MSTPAILFVTAILLAGFGDAAVARGGAKGYFTHEDYSRHPTRSSSEHRSREVPREFERQHPCPSTGATSGACPGYIRDHIVPLCGGGADATWNMQWQTRADSYAKDRIEREGCRRH